jgi:hypothetical protein
MEAQKITPTQAERLHEKAFEQYIKGEVSLEEYETITTTITQHTDHSLLTQAYEQMAKLPPLRLINSTDDILKLERFKDIRPKPTLLQKLKRFIGI